MRHGGLEALKGISVGGRPSILTSTDLEWIAKALRGGASMFGFRTGEWTSGRLRKLIEQRFGIAFSRVYTWQLATNLGLGHRLAKRGGDVRRFQDVNAADRQNF